MDATLYRDGDYGALAVYREGDGVVTIDHGFAREDREAALASLSAKGRCESRGNGVSYWLFKEHREVALLNLDNALRQIGYEADRLTERAILTVDLATAEAPDLPADSRLVMNEVVERGLRRHVEVAWGALGDLGQVDEHEARFFPRPNARDSMGKPLPFMRVRALLAAKGVEAARVAENLSAALKPVEGSLVRATVSEVDEDRFAVEFAVAPPKEACEAFLSESLPTFEAADICGTREVHFILNGMLSDEVIDRLIERATACTAATKVTARDNRYVIACVPAGHKGDAGLDLAFSNRVGWILEELDEYDPDIEHVGGLDPVLPESDPVKTPNLDERPA